jgi:CBS domain-containing protein
VLALSDYTGQDVVGVRGSRIGRLRDLAVSLDEPLPLVSALMVDRGRRIPWALVGTFERSEVTLAGEPGPAPGSRNDASDDRTAGELWLARDVLDCQVVDIEGRRLARVGDVELARDGPALRVVAVEVGLSSVLRRLGPRRLARRLHRDALPWDAIHLASGPGHELQLSSPTATVHRLGPEELVHLVGRLPVERGAEVLRTVPISHAAGALASSRPEVAGHLVRELGPAEAPSIIAQMPVDDAAGVLRGLDQPERERMLEGLSPERADGILRLLGHDANTAGAIMTLDVRTARPDEPLDAVRDRIARDPPSLDGLLTVVVVDAERRPVGVLPAAALIAGRGQPIPVPPVSADAALDDVIALFATYDVLSVPVVDGDGRLAGAVAVDDLLDVLLEERLPGGSRYGVMAARRRAPT